MGQKLRDDKIGILTQALGTITLAPSILTIGGQQYVTTSNLSLVLSSLTANTLYMLYVVLNGGVFTLINSINYNSIGPIGYTSWKLVGAFYTESTTFKGFLDVNGIDARVVAAKATSSQAMTYLSTVSFPTTNWVIQEDTHGVFGTNGIWVCPVAGLYRLHAFANITFGSLTGLIYNLSGVGNNWLTGTMSTGAGGDRLIGHAFHELAVGDQVKVGGYAASSNSTNVTLEWSISRLFGPIYSNSSSSVIPLRDL